MAEEMLAAYLIIKSSDDLDCMPDQDDEALGLLGTVAAEHATPEEAVAEVQTCFGRSTAC